MRMRRFRAIYYAVSILLFIGVESLLAYGAGTSGVVVLHNGKEVPFERIAPDSDFTGEYLRFTDEGAEVDAVPSFVDVRIGNLRSLRVGGKIEKDKRVPSTSRTVSCQWLEIVLTLKTNGESVYLRSGVSSESDAISACGGPVALHVEKSGIRRQIDLSAVKEIRFGVGRNEMQEAGLTLDDISVVSIDPAQNEGYWSQGIERAIGFQVIQGIPLFNSVFDRGPVVCSHPVSQDRPAVFNIKVSGPTLRFAVRSHPSGDSKLEIWSGSRFIFGEVIDQAMSWKDIVVQIPDNVQTVQLRHSATDWSYEFLYFDFKVKLP